MLSAETDNVRYISELLCLGVCPNLKDASGKTTLEYAKVSDFFAPSNTCFEFLLESLVPDDHFISTFPYSPQLAEMIFEAKDVWDRIHTELVKRYESPWKAD